MYLLTVYLKELEDRIEQLVTAHGPDENKFLRLEELENLTEMELAILIEDHQNYLELVEKVRQCKFTDTAEE